jgi:hypothetical protein
MFLHGQTSDRLTDAGVGEQQARMFRDEFLHLAERVLDYINTHCQSLGPLCKGLGSAVDSMRRRNTINGLAGECNNQTLLQVLAGSPALICGHEVQKPHPRKCHQDALTEKRSWILLENMHSTAQQSSSGNGLDLVESWLRALKKDRLYQVKKCDMPPGIQCEVV